MAPLLRILAHAKKLWPYYAAISVLTILLSVSNLLQPILAGRAIDELGKGDAAQISVLIGIAVIIFLQDAGSTIVSNISQYLGDIMAAKLQKQLSANYFAHLLNLPQSYFDRELSGKIINRLNRSIAQIVDFINMMSNNFLQFIFTTVFSLIAVALISWQVAVLLAALYPIFIFLTVRTSSTWQNYQHKINDHKDIATGRFTESVSQVKVVKSFIREATELRFFNRQLQKVTEITKPQSKYWHTRDTYRRLILNVIFFAVYVVIFVQAANGDYSAGDAVTLMLLAMNIRLPIFTITFLVENTQKAIADSKDYFEVMAIEPSIKDSPQAKPLKITDGAIEFHDVEFTYEGGEKVLRGLTFSIAPDSKVALVGESGEGKTTITNLLMRLYELSSGSIQIDGNSISEVTQKSLRSQIGVVFQDPALFSGTIRDNIAYGAPRASDAEVEAAAKAANAHEFISGFSKGYATQIGERGLKLSGGQKQRIAIARALLKDAPILVLDEATSSLDNKSEVLVQQALTTLMKGRTTIIIAHRLSTIQSVDTIITLRGGKVDEIGTPDELAKSGGIYASLLELQSAKPTKRVKSKLQAYDIAK
jgi:ATP-binding cassette subfamily B protein